MLNIKCMNSPESKEAVSHCDPRLASPPMDSEGKCSGGIVKATLRVSEVEVAAVSSDGTLIAGGRGSVVTLWDAETGQRMTLLAGHMDLVPCVQWSTGSPIVASGSLDTTVILWDATNAQRKQTLAGHSNSVTSVAFSPDGRSIASGSLDNQIIVWDTESGRPMHTLSGHGDGVTSVA